MGAKRDGGSGRTGGTSGRGSCQAAEAGRGWCQGYVVPGGANQTRPVLIVIA